MLADFNSHKLFITMMLDNFWSTFVLETLTSICGMQLLGYKERKAKVHLAFLGSRFHNWW